MSSVTHRMEHGSIVCTALRAAEGAPRLRVSGLLVPPNGVEADRPAEEHTTWIEGTHSCLLVRIGDRLVLIDGGLEADIVLTGLQHAGVAPESVDLVLITHGDTDHIAGLVDGAHRSIYTGAVHVLHRSLWEAWTSDGTRGDPDPFYDDVQRAVAAALTDQIAARVQLVDGDEEIAPAIRSLATPGHRPSHLAYELTVEDTTLLHVGDAMIAPALLEQHTRGNGFDADPQMGIRSRRILLERACNSGALVYVPHFPWPGFIRVSRQASGYRWQSMAEPPKHSPATSGGEAQSVG